MELTNKQKDRLKNMPIIETNVRKSNDGKYVVHTTEITSIKPIQYYEAVVDEAKEIESE